MQELLFSFFFCTRRCIFRTRYLHKNAPPVMLFCSMRVPAHPCCTSPNTACRFVDTLVYLDVPEINVSIDLFYIQLASRHVQGSTLGKGLCMQEGCLFRCMFVWEKETVCICGRRRFACGQRQLSGGCSGSGRLRGCIPGYVGLRFGRVPAYRAGYNVPCPCVVGVVLCAQA